MTQQSNLQTDTREEHYRQLDRIHRRQSWRSIFLPFMLTMVLVVIVAVIVLTLGKPSQVAVIADFLYILFVLCPIVICQLPIVMLLFAAIAAMSKLHNGTKSPLRRIEELTYKAEQEVDSWSTGINHRIIEMSVRFAPIRHILTFFDSPSDTQTEGSNDGKPTTSE